MKRAGVKSSFFCNKFITNAKPHLNNVFITNFFNKGYKILKYLKYNSHCLNKA